MLAPHLWKKKLDCPPARRATRNYVLLSEPLLFAGGWLAQKVSWSVVFGS
jgi:hypothetical protein